MNPGELKQRLIFHQPSDKKDKDGFPINEPTEYTRAWAKLKTLKNKERDREFTIRYQNKLSDGVRPHNLCLVWRGIEHNILSVENDNGLNVTMSVVASAVRRDD